MTVMIMVMIVMIMVMVVMIMAMILIIMVMNVMIMAMIVMIMVMNVMIRVMNVMIMVMIFVQSKFGGLLKTRLLLRNFCCLKTATANFFWTNCKYVFLTDFGRFCPKYIMHACRLVWPSVARTATLDGRSWRRPRTGDEEKYYYKDHRGSKEDIDEEKTK